MEPRRYLPLVRVLGAVLSFVLLVNLVMARVDPDPGQLRVRSLQRKALSRVAGGKFGVILGLSTAGVGFNARLLEAETGYPWVNLGGTGRDMFDLRRWSSSLAGTEPERIVLGVHPMWLAEPRGGRAEARNRLLGEGPLDRLLWAARRPLIKGDYLELVRSVRDRFLRWRPDSALWPDDEPAFALENRPRARPEELARQREFWLATGVFEPASYAGNERQSALYAEVLSLLGERVTIVLMPESEELRSQVPPVAEEELRRLSARPVLDLRAAVPDADFYDGAHLNVSGRDLLTRKLLEADFQGASQLVPAPTEGVGGGARPPGEP